MQIFQIMDRMMRMACLAIMMAACGTVALAQNVQQQQKREKLAEAQARYIANALALSDDAAARYIKTYCEYQKEMWSVGPRVKQKARQDRTEAEVKQAIKNRFDQSEKIISIRKKYYKEYSEFMTQKQIERAYELEKTAVKRLAAKRGKKVQNAKGMRKAKQVK